MIRYCLRGIWFYLVMTYLKLCTVADMKEAITSNEKVISGLLVGKYVCVRKWSWPDLMFYSRS